ncbi:MAG TPA: O-antigen ligase family protein [Allosphingosinicella sp.]|nr:O-antigen ligase family protein [Allosphingosinicella sp.]
MTPRHTSSRIILDSPAKVALAVLAGAWVAAAVGGGSARADIPLLVAVRLAAVTGLALLLLLVPRDRLRPQRPLLLFAAAAAILLALQLIPLPPSLWAALPGRDFYQALAGVDGVGGVWRPISFAPDLTWNSLLSLLPPLLFLLAVPVLGTRVSRWLLIGLWITILVSGLVGLLQMAGGPDSPLRFYRINNQDSAIGFFANRNHQAAFLTMGIPLAAWWAGRGNPAPRHRRARWLIAGSAVLFLLTAAVMTQSRMGGALVLLSFLLTAALIVRGTGLRKGTLAALAAAGLAAAALAWVGLTTWSESRLSLSWVEQDLRFKVLPETLEAAKTFFPVGAGWGSFAQIYPRFESVEDLAPEYLNHSHSELTQIVIEGGVAAIVLLLVFLLWYGRAAWRAWSAPSGHGTPEARLCTILIALPLVGSVTDYPLRTPLMACAFAGAAAILAVALREGAARR